MARTRIMVVEDEVVVGTQIQMSLERMGYCARTLVSSGQAALDRIPEENPDIVLMDIRLRGPMDGIEAARRIRVRHGTPVVFLTSYADDATLERAKKAEPYGYLLKPVQDREIQAAVETALNRAGLEKRLLASENRFRSLFQFSNDVVLICDAQARILESNARTGEVLGYEPGQIQNASFLTLVAEEDREAFAQRVDALTRTEGFRMESRMRTASGSTLDVEVSTRMTDPETGIVQTVIRDISQRKQTEALLQQEREALEIRVRERTAALVKANKALKAQIAERRKAEKALRENEANFRNIYDSSPVMMQSIDSEGHLCDANRKWLEVMGYTRDEILGRRADIVMTQESAGRTCSEILPRVWTDGSARNVPLQYITKTGRIMDVLLDCDVTIAPAVRPVCRCVVRDVTERKRMEQALRDSEARYSTLVEQSLAGICVVQGGQIVFVNERMAEIHGYSKAEMIGMRSVELIHPADRALVENLRRKRLQGTPVPSHYEVMGVKKDGRTIWTGRRFTRIQYDGKPAILGHVLDITGRKEMELALRKSEEELRRLSSKLLAVEELGRKRMAQDLHDIIGQRMSAVKFRLEHAIQLARDGHVDMALDSFESLIPMMQESIDEVREIHTGLWPSILDDLGILATVSWCCRRFRQTQPAIALREEIAVKEEEIPLPLKTVLYRILHEALSNVARHSRADTADVRLARRGPVLEMMIRDNGAGFDVERVPVPDQMELGVGLASMRERIQLSGGTFLIESIPGQGTTVRACWSSDTASRPDLAARIPEK